MSGFVEMLKTSLRKRNDFNVTYWELSNMPRETAIDLGMFPEDAYQTALHAVYGR